MRTATSRPLAALLAVIALVASACGGGNDDPASELAEAIKGLGDTSFTYALTLDVDPEAASQLLGPDVGMAAGFVNSVALKGAKADDAFSFSAALMGFEPFNLRSYNGGEELFVKVGLQEMLGAFGGNLGDLGFGADAFADLPGDAGELFTALFAGEWVGFVGLDPDAAAEDQADTAAELGLDLQQLQQVGADLRERLGDIDALLEDLASVTRTESDGEVRFDIDIRTEPALREVQRLLEPVFGAIGESGSEEDLEADLQEMLAGAPESIPGLSATVRDGDLVEMAFDIGRLVSALDESQTQVGAGEIVLRLAFDDHGSASVEDRPAGAKTYDQEQLEQLGELMNDPSLLSGALGGGGAGADVEDADSQALLLATVQTSVYDEDGAYTDDLNELLVAVSNLLVPGARYGVCTYDDGQLFIVAAEVDGEVAYYDATFVSHASPDGLGCTPELVDNPYNA